MSRRALISVYDKRGLEELARGLVELGFEIVASGGTAKSIAGWGLPNDASLMGSPPDARRGRLPRPRRGLDRVGLRARS